MLTLFTLVPNYLLPCLCVERRVPRGPVVAGARAALGAAPRGGRGGSGAGGGHRGAARRRRQRRAEVLPALPVTKPLIMRPK